MSAGAPTHYGDLAAVEDAAWAMLAAGAASRHEAFHQVQVATVAADGTPAVRTVVLRGADRTGRVLRFHTDARSEKFAALAGRPALELAAYDHAAKVQVRAAGRAVLHHRDAVAVALWDAMRDQARACYRQRLAPGTPLDAPDAAEDAPLDVVEGLANFVAVDVHVATLEWVYLAATGHRRALLCYTSPLGARWVAP